MASIPRILTTTTRPLLSLAKPTAAALRMNSTSTSTVASRVASEVQQRVAVVEKPSSLEASVPVMWALSGAAILAAWSRIDDKEEGVVEKLLIV